MITRPLLLVSLILSTSALQAQDKQAKIEIVQPQAGQQLQGAVEVQVKLSALDGVSIPSQIHVGLKGG